MALEEYRKKRDFGVTPEPSGEKHTPHAGLSFVVQKHKATRLHWDFRIELDGVLLSWAVPRGPSLDMSEKRLAMRVEDHPIDYGSFEGVIPKGEYGGGTVMLWDRGTWEPDHGDPREHLNQGHLKFYLYGERMRGRWMLVKTKGYGGRSAENSWLLFKERDEEMRPHAEFEAAAEWTTSVATGRTMEEIAADTGAVWHSNESVEENVAKTHGLYPPPLAGASAIGKGAKTKGRGKQAAPAKGGTKAAEKVVAAGGAVAAGESTGPGGGAAGISAIKGVKKAAMPSSIDVELATLVKEIPEGERWLHEIKFDGYRMLSFVRGGKVRIISRNQHDWTERFPEITTAVAALPVSDAILDGEVVVMRPDCTNDFQALQNYARRGHAAELHYVAFDLLYLDGHDLRGAALEDRKRLLFELVPRHNDRIRYVDHIEGRGDAFFSQACEYSLEGVVSKRRDTAYRSGRGKDWVKTKCMMRQEFVVVGYTDPGGSRQAFGALVLGLYEKDGLATVGRVGTGFSDETLRDIFGLLKGTEVPTPPVLNPPSGPAAEGVHWVEPKLVAEVQFAEWTDEHSLRHPSFIGLREDKPVKDVVTEKPAATPKPPKEPEPKETGPKDAAPTKAAAKKTAAKEASTDGATAGQRKDNAKHGTARDKKERLLVAGVSLSNPDRVLWPDVPFTKVQLAHYYERVADLILPHITNRPLSLVRCPSGYTGECFYQKHIEHFPASVGTVDIFEPDEKNKVPYACVNNLAGIVGLVQMGVLEIHPWGSRSDLLDKPDRLIFDLDPDTDLPWQTVSGTAQLLRSELSHLGLESWTKTTGGKGLHVVVPVRRGHDWDHTRAFSRAFVDSIVRIEPRLFTSNMRQEQRKGRVFIDYLRNARGATAVAPYGTRARPGAPVAVPVTWDELAGFDKRPEFTVENVASWVDRGPDPWAGMPIARQSITVDMLRRLTKG